MTMLVCVIGTDGSGKTTLSRALVEQLNRPDASNGDGNSAQARHVWLGSESILMKPIRLVLRRLWNRSTQQVKGATQGEGSLRTDYAREIARKRRLALRFWAFVRLYQALIWFDYDLQLAIKRWRHRGSTTLVADRYIFDVAVNLGLTLGWSPEDVVAHLRRRLGAVTLPAVRIFLRVDPEISMARKDDILDIDYLRLRLAYYDAIANSFGFTILDGTQPPTQAAAQALAEVKAAQDALSVVYVHANNADIGGADKVLALMAEHMGHRAGVRTTAVLRLSTDITQTYAQACVPLILHPFVRPQVSQGFGGILRLALRAPSALWFFWSFFGRERPDIVHVNDLYDFLPALAARARGIPVVWHIRMIQQRPALRRSFAHLIRAVAAVSVSVSQAVRDHYFGPNTGRHHALVIHDLGNAALIADPRDPGSAQGCLAEVPPGKRLAVMIGRIEPWKGQDVFIQAVAALSPSLRERWCFALVGGSVDGKEAYFERTQEEARRVGILHLGQRSDVPDILRAADVSVHASVTPDPFPGVVIESLLAGAATLAAGEGGTLEMIEDGVEGRLFPPGDHQALTLLLEEVLNMTPTPRAVFGHAARSKALSLVDASRVDTALHAVYRSLHPDHNQ
ncbi:MAG: glycosyltransferase [Alphaproteobacteria bacterium]